MSVRTTSFSPRNATAYLAEVMIALIADIAYEKILKFATATAK